VKGWNVTGFPQFRRDRSQLLPAKNTRSVGYFALLFFSALPPCLAVPGTCSFSLASSGFDFAHDSCVGSFD
jgi:hypothetical protein